MHRIRGLELLFHVQRKNIKFKSDCIVLALHCIVIKENLDCVVINHEGEEKMTELLPEQWNKKNEEYTLFYRSKDTKITIRLEIAKSEHRLRVTAVVNDSDTFRMSININRYVTSNFKKYETAFKKLDVLENSFREEILRGAQEIFNNIKSPAPQDRKKVRGPAKPSLNPTPSKNLGIKMPPSPKIPSPNPPMG